MNIEEKAAIAKMKFANGPARPIMALKMAFVP
jgi:hypothetical protein